MARKRSDSGTAPAVKLAEVHVHDPLPGRPATYVRLVNTGPEPVELAGWTLELDGTPLRFPPGSLLKSGQSCAVAREPEAYARQHGELPEYGYGPGHPSVRPMERPEGEPELAPWAGRALLRDPDGRLADALYWGNLQPGPGWEGQPVPSPPPGEVIHRVRGEEVPARAGAPAPDVADTDTAGEWEPNPSWLGRRVLRPGQTLLPLAAFRTRRPVVAFVAPDSGYAALAPVLDGARHTLDICLYQFTSPVLLEKVIAACRRGVAVRLLLDGSPYGGVLDKTRYVARQVAAAGGRVRWLGENKQLQVPKRYRYIHAKYVVADRNRSVVLSENFSRHSLPVHPRGGNRGWGVVVRSRVLARYLAGVFAADWDPAKADTHPFMSGDETWGGPPADFQPELADVRGGYEPRFAAERVRGRAQITPILAPDHTLYRQGAILGLLAGARESIQVQVQYIPVNWL